jgi:hypothetical protein
MCNDLISTTLQCGRLQVETMEKYSAQSLINSNPEVGRKKCMLHLRRLCGVIIELPNACRPTEVAADFLVLISETRNTHH